MKLIGFWLLIVLAVLVPATASVATSMFCPTVSAAKAKLPGPVMQAGVGMHAALSGAHAPKVRVAGRKPSTGPDQQPPHCCEATPCSHCASCGSCVSMVTDLALDAAGRHPAEPALPEPGGPRAEFLLSGQERPPRSS